MKPLNIIVGVTGGIAAYKSCELIRLLRKQGHAIKVVMTDSAHQFVHSNTFSALTQHEVYSELFGQSYDTMPHITLAKWAEVIIIAPATANTLAKLAAGHADDLLTNICLASEAICYLAPSMNKVMWEKQITKKNIAALQSLGYRILLPEFGEQACGDIGVGCMMEVEQITKQITNISNSLQGINILITVGATRERFDPIRYVGNFSSGKMGCALATACQQLGATVHVISGYTEVLPPLHCHIKRVNTAKEMLAAVMSAVEKMDIFISAAAVTDYVPAYSPSKIKKPNESITMTLTKTTDILSSVTRTCPNVFTVGFCAETSDLMPHAKRKLAQKRLHAIIANQVFETGEPFGCELNTVSYITSHRDINLPKDTKRNLAYSLATLIAADFHKRDERLTDAMPCNSLM